MSTPHLDASVGASSSETITQLSKAHMRGNLRTLSQVILYLRADLHRYQGEGASKFWKHFLFTPGYKYTVWMRLTGWATTSRIKKYSIGIPLKLILSRCRYKYGIAIPEYTVIGPGLFINRFGGIYVNGDAEIGSNCNLAQMIILGQVNRGARAGSPVIGDNCSIAAGACIVGHIRIGASSIVGNNAVVTKDMPENSVIGGIPAKPISSAGSAGYVNRPVPQSLLDACLRAG